MEKQARQSERRGVGEAHARPGGKGPGRNLEGPSGPEGEEKASEEQRPGRWGLQSPRGVSCLYPERWGATALFLSGGAARKSGLQFRRFSQAVRPAEHGGGGDQDAAISVL